MASTEIKRVLTLVPWLLEIPAGFDWQHWLNRYDKMQKRYLVRRDERYALMVRMIRETQKTVSLLLDLGCGTGSSMLPLLEAFPEAQVFGIDFDPTLLPLAKKRLAKFGARVRFVLADLRDASWINSLPTPVDAVVSATALHWFRSEQLASLYYQIAQILRPGGIFLNADHVASDFSPIQKAWERHREEMRRENGNTTAEDWDGFWDAYAHALNLNIHQIHQRVIGNWEGGIEEGLPLAWHFDQLRASGFSSVDCFWRCDCDAIYGGIRG